MACRYDTVGRKRSPATGGSRTVDGLGSADAPRSVVDRQVAPIWSALGRHGDDRTGPQITIRRIDRQRKATVAYPRHPDEAGGRTPSGRTRPLALVGARRATDDGGYDTNTMLYGDPKVLGDIAADDEFQAKVTVLRAYTYPSLVGPTRVPLLLVHSLRVL